MKGKMFVFLTISVASLVLLLFWVPAMSAPEKPQEASEQCETCHAEAFEAFALNPHAATESKCIACHQTVEAHLKDSEEGTMFAFEDTELASTKTAVCLTCHQETHPKYLASPHAKGGMDCTSCHDIHEGKRAASLLPNRNVSEGCSDCHEDVLAKFSLNERHRLQEGSVSCTSCHNPHEPQPRFSLAGFKQEQCYECHSDKRGPFVYEHGSVQVEGCMACHEPHGSVNRHQLTMDKVANLCYSCHVAIPGFHTRFTVDSNCANCHSTIHGSNLSPAFLQ